MSTTNTAIKKLLEIYDEEGQAHETKVTVVLALGRVGGPSALTALINIYDTPGLAHSLRVAATSAIGEAARTL